MIAITSFKNDNKNISSKTKPSIKILYLNWWRHENKLKLIMQNSMHNLVVPLLGVTLYSRTWHNMTCTMAGNKGHLCLAQRIWTRNEGSRPAYTKLGRRSKWLPGTQFHLLFCGREHTGCMQWWNPSFSAQEESELFFFYLKNEIWNYLRRKNKVQFLVILRNERCDFYPL